jgi:zinc protease
VTGTTERIDLSGGAKLFVETSHALPLVTIAIALGSGATRDPQGKDGLCRITSRMLRRGCEGLVSQAIDATIDRLGAELSVDVSASNVTIHAQVIRRNLEPFIELVARLLGTPTFDDDELARLRRETIAEIIEARDSDRSLAQVAFRRAVFAGHPYARSAVGTPSSVESIARTDVRTLYAEEYRRGSLVLGFAGDVTRDEAARFGERLARALPEGPSRPCDVAHPAPASGRRLVFVDKPERTQTQILIGSLGTWPRDPDHVPLSVGCAIFGGTFTSRMMREVRSKRGWSYGAYARLAIEQRRHSFSMWTFPAATDTAACIELELQMLEDLLTNGVTSKETTFMKRYLTRSHAFDVDTAAKRLHQALDVELLDLPSDYYSSYVDHVEAVTHEAANQALKERLSVDNQCIVVVGTQDSLLENVQRAIPRLESTNVVPFDVD